MDSGLPFALVEFKDPSPLLFDLEDVSTVFLVPFWVSEDTVGWLASKSRMDKCSYRFYVALIPLILL